MGNLFEFGNVAEKIKIIAKACAIICVLVAGVGVLGLFVVLANGEEWAAGIWIGIAVGGACGYCSSLLLYAVGVITATVQEIKEKLYDTGDKE